MKHSLPWTWWLFMTLSMIAAIALTLFVWKSDRGVPDDKRKTR